MYVASCRFRYVSEWQADDFATTRQEACKNFSRICSVIQLCRTNDLMKNIVVRFIILESCPICVTTLPLQPPILLLEGEEGVVERSPHLPSVLLTQF